MKTYKVSFFRLNKTKDELGKSTTTDKEFLGSVTVDDSGTDRGMTLQAKAFRVASPVCQLADRTETIQVA